MQPVGRGPSNQKLPVISFLHTKSHLGEPLVSSFMFARIRMGNNRRTSHTICLPKSLTLVLYSLTSISALSGSDYDYGAHPRFVCTPIPVGTDPACFPAGGPAMGGPGPSGPGHHSPLGGSPNAWWGMTDEAKTTILHLRESLVQQKETILDQRETIRELTAKLAMCEGFGRGAGSQDDHHKPESHSPLHHSRTGNHPSNADNVHHGDQLEHHGNHVPDTAQDTLIGGHRPDSGHGSIRGKEKHVIPGEMSSSPAQRERILQTLKERLENLRTRNTSNAYSSSLKELLQRKINVLELQMHHQTTPVLASPDHHDDDGHHDADSGHHDDGTHHNDDHHDDGHHSDHDDHHNDEDDHHSGHDGDHDTGHHGDSHHSDEHHDDDDHLDDHDDSHHDNGSHQGNEADDHRYPPISGYQPHGSHPGLHSNKLESVFNQLHHTGSSRKKAKSPDAFQIGFPMRTNYMYGLVKTTLLQEIFGLTLCLWIKAGSGPGLGTPFSYSVPGQANELVLIEWGNNPMELLVDDKAVTLPLSLNDGKWHHVCVTWSTRDGQWEAYQDGVQRGSGENLSAWHPIKPGGVFILGQEQDTLGGRFDATQSFVGEISDVQMWSHVLSTNDIYNLASCGSHLSGDVIAWSPTMLELHGGVTKYPFDPCH